MTADLRYGTDYPEPEVATVLDFSRQEGFLGAIEACTGVGACRKVGVGTMCPSYMATRDEDHSTRGRANVLREAITGGLPGGLTSRAVYEVLDLCLECKVQGRVPQPGRHGQAQVQWLQHYHDEHGVTADPGLRERRQGGAARPGLAPVANALLPLRPVRWLLEKTVGVDARRVMPRYEAGRFELVPRGSRAARRQGPPPPRRTGGPTRTAPPPPGRTPPRRAVRRHLDPLQRPGTRQGRRQGPRGAGLRRRARALRLLRTPPGLQGPAAAGAAHGARQRRQARALRGGRRARARARALVRGRVPRRLPRPRARRRDGRRGQERAHGRGVPRQGVDVRDA